MLGISGTELIIILFFGFLIFGPEKLPQMGRTVGRAIRQFREASDAMSKKIKDEVTDPFNEAISPYKDDLEDLGAPLKDDINAINKNIQETKQIFANPLKDVLNPSESDGKETAKKAGVVAGTAASAANDAATDATADAAAEATADPFAESAADAATDAPAKADTDTAPAKGEGKPLPDVKTGSIAASLYGLDAEDGE